MHSAFKAAALIAAGCAGLAMTATNAAACRYSGANGVKGAVVDGSMSLQNGKSCFIRNFTNASDSVGNRRFPTTDMRVTSRPSRGSVSIEGSRIIYKAAAGATGSDQFTYRTRLKSGNVYDYRVNVTIY